MPTVAKPYILENESIFGYKEIPTLGIFALDANINGCSLADIIKFV